MDDPNILSDSHDDANVIIISDTAIRRQQSKHFGAGKWRHVNKAKGSGSPTIIKPSQAQAKSPSPARVTTTSNSMSTHTTLTTAAANNTQIVADLTDSSASASASAPTHSIQLESELESDVDVFDLTVDGADTLQAGDTLYFRRSFHSYMRPLTITRIVKYTMLYEPFGTNRDQKCEIEHIVYFDNPQDEKWVTTRLETSPGRRFQKVGTVHNVPLSMYNFVACEERHSWDDDQNWR